MPILQSANAKQIGRLLELFPIANLRDRWPGMKGGKSEVGLAVAQTGDLAGMTSFIADNLSCCKQHVYIFSHAKHLKTLPNSVLAGEKLSGTSSRATYLIRVAYKVYLSDPLEEVTLEFLWPLRLELRPELLVARFVVLEKGLSPYFNRPYHLGGKSLDEDMVLKELNENDTLTVVDLHKGIKKLWAADGFMDCFRATYKKPMSVASEQMDEEKGIKEHNQELYAILRKSTLLNVLFEIEDQESTVSIMSAEPPMGFLGFPRYTETKGHTDAILERLLANN